MIPYTRDFSEPSENLKTTQNIDYQIPEISRPLRYHSWDRKSAAPNYIKRKPYRPKDLQTFEYWSAPEKVPFSLDTEAPPITRTVVNFKFEIIPKAQDDLKEEVIKSRPRQIMTPAISIDDIEDKEIRELICNDMYLTTSMKAAQDLNLKTPMRPIPNTTFPRSGQDIPRDFSVHKQSQPGLRKKGKYWEPKQYTSLVDPTNHFWSQHKKNPPSPTVTVEEKKEIRELIDKNELRSGYDIQMAGYSGYVPLHMYGPLRKQDLTNK